MTSKAINIILIFVACILLSVTVLAALDWSIQSWLGIKSNPNDTCTSENCTFNDVSTNTTKPEPFNSSLVNCTRITPILCDDHRTVKEARIECVFPNGTWANMTDFYQQCDDENLTVGAA